MDMTSYVAVCGPDPCTREVAGQAEDVGRFLARAGAVVVCGGHGGVMGSASKGAAEAGGTVIGILPGSSRTEGNPYLTVSISTGMGEMRNALIVRSADALIAIAGEFGTLSEIALALKIGVPVVGLGTWELAKSGRKAQPFAEVETPEEAVQQALRLASDRSGGGSG